MKFRHSFVSAQVFGLSSSTGPLGFPNKVCGTRDKVAMRSVLAPAPHPEPTSRLSNVMREDSFLRNATKW